MNLKRSAEWWLNTVMIAVAAALVSSRFGWEAGLAAVLAGTALRHDNT